MAVCESIYYDFFDFRLDVEKQQLIKNGETVQLTHKAFQILLLLVQNSGQITKKEDIFAELWSDSFVEDGNLTQQIYVLRKVLGQTPDGQSYIETIPRQGYRFTLSPDQISVANNFRKNSQFSASSLDNGIGRPGEFNENIHYSGNDFKLPSSTNFNGNGENDSKLDRAEKSALFHNASAAKRRLFSRHSFIVALILLLIGLSVTAAVYKFYYESPQSTADVGVRSIAVLPFKAIGGDVDKEKLGLGMADAVISRLSKLQQIVVRPTSSVFRYTDQPVNAVSAGRELGTDAVLEGTTQCDGKRVRVSVQLVRVADGKSLWAENFQEDVSDIFAVQDSISAKVATALSINLTKQQRRLLEQRTTNSSEAFQAYQLGIYLINKRTKNDLLKAAEYFERAVDIDPNYAQAFAGLADSYSMLGYYDFADADEMKEKAKTSAEKALILNDSLSEAYVALAMTYIIKRENYGKAQELLERAVMLAPYNASARHRYGWILLTNGKLNEGAHELRLAREYDPLSPAANRAYCSVLVMQRKFSEAVEQCEQTIEIYLNTPNSRRVLARAYFYNGRYADAFNQLETQIKSGTEDEVVSARGEYAFYYTKLGRVAEAQKIYAELERGYENDRNRSFDLALIAYALGKKDEAVKYCREMQKLVVKAPDSHLSLAYDPVWDEIKADPQFTALFPK